jgi:hypothetical protein
LYGFAAVLGSLERTGLSLGRAAQPPTGMQVFCLILQKEALSFL